MLLLMYIIELMKSPFREKGILHTRKRNYIQGKLILHTRKVDTTYKESVDTTHKKKGKERWHQMLR